jgi:hypothetical protein
VAVSLPAVVPAAAAMRATMRHRAERVHAL